MRPLETLYDRLLIPVRPAQAAARRARLTAPTSGNPALRTPLTYTDTEWVPGSLLARTPPPRTLLTYTDTEWARGSLLTEVIKASPAVGPLWRAEVRAARGDAEAQQTRGFSIASRQPGNAQEFRARLTQRRWA